MAHTKFPVEVLTPDGEVFNDEVEMISTRTTVGSIGILARHTPTLATLEPTELRIYRSEGEVERFAQGEGYLQVAEGGSVLVLVDDARRPEDLDAGEIRGRLDRARGDLDRAEGGSEHARACAREVRRWETFLALAEGTATAG